MNLDTQFKLNSNVNYQRYIRENSHWYKILNRDPSRFDDFVTEMKERYRLRTSDRISDALDKIEMLQMFFNVFK